MIAPFQRPRRTRIKFCGITNPREAELAYETGADVVGAILAPSPRRIDLDMAERLSRTRPASSASLVAVVGADVSIVPRLCDLGFTVQFAAPIEPDRARSLTGGAPYIRVVHLSATGDADADTDFMPFEIPLFDTARENRLGGSGRVFRWSRVASISSRRAVIVAGGLDSTNVASCVRQVRPFGVDVRSGIEAADRKSAAKMRAFVRAVRSADAAVRSA